MGMHETFTGRPYRIAAALAICFMPEFGIVAACAGPAIMLRHSFVCRPVKGQLQMTPALCRHLRDIDESGSGRPWQYWAPGRELM